MKKPKILVLDEQYFQKARNLADSLGTEIAHVEETGYTYILVEERLSFVSHLTKPPLRLTLDFSRGRIAYRLRQAMNEPLIKAFQDVPAESYIFDTTFGFGEDSVMLAARGHKIQAAEKNSYVFSLMQDALAHAEIENINLKYGAAENFLQKLVEKPYAIYVDPMFKAPKSAKVKKEMQVLQLLTENDDCDLKELINLSYQICSRKLVIKRDIKAPPLLSYPHMSLKTKTVRYDIYRKQ